MTKMNPQGFRDKRALTDLDSPPVGLLIEGENKRKGTKETSSDMRTNSD